MIRKRVVSVTPMRRLSAVLMALACLAPLINPAAAAAADFNLTTSPLPIDLSVKPGASTSTPIKVENTGSQSVKVKVTLMKFKANGTSGKPEIIQPQAGDESVSWVSFSETSFQAEPNVWHTIIMTIRAPKEAAFGYYYAVVFSEDSVKPVAPGRHNVVTGAVATLVLLDVNAPGEKRTLNVVSFSSSKKLYDYLPASFDITVHNSGNVHAVPSGDIFISRDGKNPIGTLEINKTQGNILPDTNRIFTVLWEDGFPRYQTKQVNGQVISDKTGKPIKQLNWSGTNLSKLRIGRYHAHMVLVYNDGTRDIPIEGELSFWVLPWKLMLLMLLVALLALGGLYALGRNTYRRIKRWRKK
ncbi:MAG TPA: hypothetical protein VLG13_03635 [Patescibacteria group bacterium]|nr:hypothetical protein [Patescibacteria group bacterium]